jgi:hypothetical protein
MPRKTKQRHIKDLKVTDCFVWFAAAQRLPSDRYMLTFKQLKQEMGEEYEAIFKLTTMMWEQRGIIDESVGKKNRKLTPKRHRRVLSWVAAGATPDVAAKKVLVDLERWAAFNKKKEAEGKRSEDRRVLQGV